MKKMNAGILSICIGISFSTTIVFPSEPQKNAPKKEVEKVEIKVNDKTHTVYVNKTMINMVNNAQVNDSCFSSTVILPTGYSKDSFVGYWYSYVLNRRTEENKNVAIMEKK